MRSETMQHQIEFVSPADFGDVRNRKIARYLKSRGYILSFVGWDRGKKTADTAFYNNIHYILRGGGESNWRTPIYYCLFIWKVFIKYLFSKRNQRKLLYAVNFEAAFGIWLASKFRRIKYTYDIWDELALSHPFPSPIKKLIRFIDKRIRRDSAFYIHVDEKRISEIDTSNHIIIYNTPYDFYMGNTPQFKYANTFAVTGYFSNVRGLESIIQFAEEHSEINFIVVGEFLNKDTEKKYLKATNVEYHHFMPQEELFDLIKNCKGIFSLYDPKLEINRLAASNKLYDAMMLGIPVIVNKQIEASEFVGNNDIGFRVNYEYDESWTPLIESDIQKFKQKGENGRSLYLNKYEFSQMADKHLLPKLEELFGDKVLPPP